MVDNNEILEELLNNFYEDKQRADHFKKMADDYNSTIKKLFSEMDINEFETESGLVAKLTIQKRENFIEPKLIEYLKQNDFSDAIDLVEIINYDKLEDMIYNGRIDASLLSEYKTIKEIPTLKVTVKKDK